MDLYVAAQAFWKLETIEEIIRDKGNPMGKSVQEIKKEFQMASEQDFDVLRQRYQSDQRKGVQSLVRGLEKTQEKLVEERKRLEKMREFERKYASAYTQICGIDEAGRGPLAGPVVAGAVILPVDCEIRYLNDSKKVSAPRRALLFDEIREKAVAYGTGIVSPERIDEINILQATYEAMRQALDQLSVSPDLLLVDAVTIPDVRVKQVGIVKGDARSVSIAAASIIAKVTRDRIMEEYHEEYPEYGFAGHKGYGSQAHIQAIKKFGPCPIHRRTFIKNFCV